MRLTVLGSSASYPGPGRACSGYLVQAGGTAVMLDCGNGTLANAGRLTDVTALGAVFVSHEHADHFADIYALQAALRYAPQGAVGSLSLHLPEGLFDRIGCALSERGRGELRDAFEPVVLHDGEAVEVGPIRFTPHAVDHVGPTFAFTIEADGGRIGYTADTRYGDAVRTAMAGCDVLLAECTLPTAYAGRAPHLSPAEAGTLASETGAGLLVLTHLWPTADRAELRADAESTYGGRILLAEELLGIDVPEPGTPSATDLRREA